MPLPASLRGDTPPLCKNEPKISNISLVFEVKGVLICGSVPIGSRQVASEYHKLAFARACRMPYAKPLTNKPLLLWRA